MIRVAEGNVEFVRRDDIQPWISIFPPKLMPDDVDFNRARRHGRLLQGSNDSRCSHKESYHDDDWNHRPGKFYLIAAVNLRRLFAVLSLPSEFHNGVDKQTENSGEDYRRYHEHKQREPENLGGWCRNWGEYVRRTEGRIGGLGENGIRRTEEGQKRN